MLRAVIVAILLVGASAALAQQTTDPRLATYRQLLSEANDRLADLSAQAQAQVQSLTKQRDDARDELSKLKASTTSSQELPK